MLKSFLSFFMHAYASTMTKRYLITLIASLLYNSTNVVAFGVSQQHRRQRDDFLPRISRQKFHSNHHRFPIVPFAAASKVEDTTTVPTTKSTPKTATHDDTYSFIQTELRGAAMKLHTKSQSPKEGEVKEQEKTSNEPYVTTHTDYLSFLIDSQHVYKAMEEIVNQYDTLTPFRTTRLERVIPLEQDIMYMLETFEFKERPTVGRPGHDYAQLLRDVAKVSIPAFTCHYYNHYFAHTAGGRMIGKQMSALLLNKKTLEFYKVRFYH